MLLLLNELSLTASSIKMLHADKLDGIGPVDNRPSTNKLHHFAGNKLLWKVMAIWMKGLILPIGGIVSSGRVVKMLMFFLLRFQDINHLDGSLLAKTAVPSKSLCSTLAQTCKMLWFEWYPCLLGGRGCYYIMSNLWFIPV